MYQKILALILGFAALFFVGYGITGFYMLDTSSHSICFEDRDCSYAVCCPLSEKEYGVCGQESECSQLYMDSRTSSGAVLQQAPTLQEDVERSYIAVSLGILLLIILAIVGYLEWREEKQSKKKTKK